jgi:hypothetical protein
MPYPKPIPPVCPVHGKPQNRATCPGCNSAYMRNYLRRRRFDTPAKAIWDRAKKRAARLGVKFALKREMIVVPEACPALGIPIIVGDGRSKHSPSLDRIKPAEGYVPDNVRVLSDYANRLKNDLTLSQLRQRARSGAPALRRDYEKVAAYVEREALLAEVREKARQEGHMGEEWKKIAAFLERRFREGLIE